MRKYIKRQLTELLDAMSEAVEMLPEAARENNSSQFTNLLADQQEAAMAVGQQVEDSEGEGTKAVQLLEQYCELLWEMSQQPENIEKTDIEFLNIWRGFRHSCKADRAHSSGFPTRRAAFLLPGYR